MLSEKSLGLTRVIGSLVLILFTTPAYTQILNPPVVWQNAQLSVQFENATIAQILNAVAQATGIKLTMDPAVAGYRESVSFKALALKVGVMKVLEGSGIDYIIIGDPDSPQGVAQLLLLGFSPKGASGPGSPGNSLSSSGQRQLSLSESVAGTPNPFSDRSNIQPPASARPADSGSFLPFPEATAAPAEGTSTQPQQRVVPANPFSPDGPPPTGTSAPPSPERRIRRGVPVERKKPF